MVAQTGLGSSPGVEQWFGFARGLPREVRGERGWAAGLPLKAYKSFLENVERRDSSALSNTMWNEERERENEPRRAEWSCEFRPPRRAARRAVASCGNFALTLATSDADGSRNSSGLSIGSLCTEHNPFPSFSSWITTASYNDHISFTKRNKREWLRMNELIICNIWDIDDYSNKKMNSRNKQYFFWNVINQLP